MGRKSFIRQPTQREPRAPRIHLQPRRHSERSFARFALRAVCARAKRSRGISLRCNTCRRARLRGVVGARYIVPGTNTWRPVRPSAPLKRVPPVECGSLFTLSLAGLPPSAARAPRIHLQPRRHSERSFARFAFRAVCARAKRSRGISLRCNARPPCRFARRRCRGTIWSLFPFPQPTRRPPFASKVSSLYRIRF
jgi:hypothetical protein